jgi:hypothetical protein
MDRLETLLFGVCQTLASAGLYGVIWVIFRNITRSGPPTRGLYLFPLTALGGIVLGFMGSGILSTIGFLGIEEVDTLWNASDPGRGFMLRHVVCGVAVALYSAAHHRGEAVVRSHGTNDAESQ